MTTPFRPTAPEYLSSLKSEPVRTNFQVLARHHAGPTAPPNPEVGWTWLDTSNPVNLRFRMFLSGTWVVILNNLLGGFPSTGGATKVVHTQAVADTTWTIVHNLNSSNVSVTFWDATSQLFIPNTVTVTDVNTLTATFLVAATGVAVVVG